MSQFRSKAEERRYNFQMGLREIQQREWQDRERSRKCQHPGCASHVTHPCEGCGRIKGGFDDHPRVRLDYFNRQLGVYYFVLATGRRVVVSQLEARLSRLSDEETELDRARYLAELVPAPIITDPL